MGRGGRREGEGGGRREGSEERRQKGKSGEGRQEGRGGRRGGRRGRVGREGSTAFVFQHNFQNEVAKLSQEAIKLKPKEKVHSNLGRLVGSGSVKGSVCHIVKVSVTMQATRPPLPTPHSEEGRVESLQSSIP